jgi:hypothetical protein
MTARLDHRFERQLARQPGGANRGNRIPPNDDRESALFLTLEPEANTAVVRAKLTLPVSRWLSCMI